MKSVRMLVMLVMGIFLTGSLLRAQSSTSWEECWKRNPCGTYDNGRPYPCGGATQSEQCVFDRESEPDEEEAPQSEPDEEQTPRWQIVEACQNVVTQCRADCRQEWNRSDQGSAERNRMRLCSLDCEIQLQLCMNQ